MYAGHGCTGFAAPAMDLSSRIPAAPEGHDPDGQGPHLDVLPLGSVRLGLPGGTSGSAQRDPWL